MAVKAVTANEI